MQQQLAQGGGKLAQVVQTGRSDTARESAATVTKLSIGKTH
jgi:hypothetical protein